MSSLETMGIILLTLIVSIEISLPERFGRRQGYAFITFENATDVEKAVAEINGKQLLGREMRVQKATSGGPYTPENGDHGEIAGVETKRARPKTRAKVCPSFVTKALETRDSLPLGWSLIM